MPEKYRKKPIVIEAMQYLAGKEAELFNFTGLYNLPVPEHPGDPESEATSVCIPTLGGILELEVGDWIVRGINGELHTCKPDIFEKTYEMADND